jgi:uncharacterized protein YdaU (DUF1376 family)
MARKTTKDSMAWFKLPTTGFLLDMAGYSDTHIAIYVKLMITYWAGGNKLPELDSIKRKVGVISEESGKALSEILDEFFPKDADGNYSHDELDRQLEDVKDLSARQSARAKSPRSHSRTHLVTSHDDPDDF